MSLPLSFTSYSLPRARAFVLTRSGSGTLLEYPPRTPDATHRGAQHSGAPSHGIHHEEQLARRQAYDVLNRSISQYGPRSYSFICKQMHPKDQRRQGCPGSLGCRVYGFIFDSTESLSFWVLRNERIGAKSDRGFRAAYQFALASNVPSFAIKAECSGPAAENNLSRTKTRLLAFLTRAVSVTRNRSVNCILPLI